MRVRLAWAALTAWPLVCVPVFVGPEPAQAIAIHGIELVVGAQTHSDRACFWKTNTFDPETKLSPMAECATEYVVVFNPAPKVPLSVYLNRLQFARLDVNGGGLHFSHRANYTVAKQIGFWEFVVLRNGGTQLFQAHVYLNVYSRRLPPVLQENGNTVSVGAPFNGTNGPHLRRVAVWCDVAASRRHVGAQLLFRIGNGNLVRGDGSLNAVAHKFDLAFSSLPELPGGPPQRNGRNSQDTSKQGYIGVGIGKCACPQTANSESAGNERPVKYAAINFADIFATILLLWLLAKSYP